MPFVHGLTVMSFSEVKVGPSGPPRIKKVLSAATSTRSYAGTFKQYLLIDRGTTSAVIGGAPGGFQEEAACQQLGGLHPWQDMPFDPPVKKSMFVLSSDSSQPKGAGHGTTDWFQIEKGIW